MNRISGLIDILTIDFIEGPPPPADALFSMDWVEKTAAPLGRGAAQSGPAIKDFYTMDAPGFIFSAPSVVIEEMFARSLFGLPSSMKVIMLSLSIIPHVFCRNHN